jgi:hypothetical protein
MAATAVACKALVGATGFDVPGRLVCSRKTDASYGRAPGAQKQLPHQFCRPQRSPPSFPHSPGTLIPPATAAHVFSNMSSAPCCVCSRTMASLRAEMDEAGKPTGKARAREKVSKVSPTTKRSHASLVPGVKHVCFSVGVNCRGFIQCWGGLEYGYVKMHNSCKSRVICAAPRRPLCPNCLPVLLLPHAPPVLAGAREGQEGANAGPYAPPDTIRPHLPRNPGSTCRAQALGTRRTAAAPSCSQCRRQTPCGVQRGKAS